MLTPLALLIHTQLLPVVRTTGSLWTAQQILNGLVVKHKHRPLHPGPYTENYTDEYNNNNNNNNIGCSKFITNMQAH